MACYQFYTIDQGARKNMDLLALRQKAEMEAEKYHATKLNDDASNGAGLSFCVVDFHDVFEGQGLEVQAVCGVVVGGHGLRVTVDHDRLISLIRQFKCGVHTGVVELDALANAVRARA